MNKEKGKKEFWELTDPNPQNQTLPRMSSAQPHAETPRRSTHEGNASLDPIVQDWRNHPMSVLDIRKVQQDQANGLQSVGQSRMFPAGPSARVAASHAPQKELPVQVQQPKRQVDGSDRKRPAPPDSVVLQAMEKQSPVRITMKQRLQARAMATGIRRYATSDSLCSVELAKMREITVGELHPARPKDESWLKRPAPPDYILHSRTGKQNSFPIKLMHRVTAPAAKLQREISPQSSCLLEMGETATEEEFWKAIGPMKLVKVDCLKLLVGDRLIFELVNSEKLAHFKNREKGTTVQIHRILMNKTTGEYEENEENSLQEEVIGEVHPVRNEKRCVLKLDKAVNNDGIKPLENDQVFRFEWQQSIKTNPVKISENTAYPQRLSSLSSMVNRSTPKADVLGERVSQKLEKLTMPTRTASKEKTSAAPEQLPAKTDQKPARNEWFRNRQMKSAESEASNPNENKRNGERRRVPTRREYRAEEVENVETEPDVALQVAVVSEPAVLPSPIPPRVTAVPAAFSVFIVEAETIATPLRTPSFASAHVASKPAIPPRSVPVITAAPTFSPTSSAVNSKLSTTPHQFPTVPVHIATNRNPSIALSCPVSQDARVEHSKCVCPEQLRRIAELEKQLNKMTRRSSLLEADNYQLRQDLRRARESRKRPAEEEVPEAPVAKRNPLLPNHTGPYFRDVFTKRKLPAVIEAGTVVVAIDQKQLTIERVKGTITDRPVIYFNDMKYFKKGKCINETIVDFGLFEIAYQNWSPELFQKTHIFNGMFYPALMRNAVLVKNATTQNISETIQRNMERTVLKYQINVFEKELLVVPACIEWHWVLAIILQPENLLISGQNSIVVVFNSIGTDGRNTYLADVIKEYLRAMFEMTKRSGGKFFDSKHKKFHDHQMKLVIMEGQPIQRNKFDCGFFLMQNFKEFFSRDWLFSATYEELKDMNWAEVAPNAQMEASQRRKKMLKRILDEYEEADRDRLENTNGKRLLS